MHDFEEPFRFLADVCVIEAFESEIFGVHDFAYDRDDYLYRIEPEARAPLRNKLIEKFNIGIPYHGRFCKWDSVIEQKALELNRFLTGKVPSVDFTQPNLSLQRTDSNTIREMILSMSNHGARRLGIAK